MREGDRTDPNRALTLAMRSLRVLAVVCVGLGIFIVVSGGLLNPLTRFRIYFLVVGTVIFLGPGIIYAALLPALKRGQRSAWIACFVTAAGQTLMAAASLAVQFVASPMSPVPMVFSVLWLAAMVQLLVHLSRGFGVVRLTERESQRGFAPLLVDPKPVLPAEAGQANGASAREPHATGKAADGRME